MDGKLHLLRFCILRINAYWSYVKQHNGNIAGFRKIKRKLVEEIKDEYFLSVEGSTDSEWVYEVTDILQLLPKGLTLS